MSKEYCFTSCPWREANLDQQELSNKDPETTALDRVRATAQVAIGDFRYANYAAESCPSRGEHTDLAEWGGPSLHCIKEGKRVRGHD